MHKLLIANRGEIARRIIRTARAMGIATVAVYSDADAHAPHVREADEAVPIGPSPAAQSYLDPAKIIAAARRTHADAVHPGYGFLSENAAFAAAVADAGLIWVGPPAAAIDAMGLKDAAKRVMKAAGVPVTPGYQGEDQSLARLEHAARGIGYPLLIKATAGGGGKGMRRVDSAAEFPEALVAAQREAERAFGHAQVLIEKYVMRARHVEVQVFADTHGNAIHLFERDCSLQRRHQKVIEEAPAPGLSERLRETLGIAAVTAAMAIGYANAGTVEFIVDLDAQDEHGDPRFYFMEMNTRLQVEHPVTEAITGLDLVEWQIRVARGELLPLSQDQVRIHGHAIEARLYAEDPESGFLPSTGTLTRLHFPQGLGVRIDSGVEQGGAVTPFYDPMIAKLIAHAPTREAAAAKLVAALDATRVEGPKTNRAFLARLAAHPAFVAGEVWTGFIDAHRDALFAHPPAPRTALAGTALLALGFALTFLPAIDDIPVFGYAAGLLFIFGGSLFAPVAIAQGSDLQVLADGQSGQRAAALGHVSEAAPSNLIRALRSQRLPEEHHRAGERNHAAHGSQGRGLACSVCSQQRGNSVLRDDQVDPVQHLRSTVTRADLV